MTPADAIQQFLDTLSGKSPRTVSTYATALRAFADYCTGAGLLSVDKLTAATIPAYARSLNGTGRALEASTRRLYLTALGRFLRYVARAQLADLNGSQVEEAVKDLKPRVDYLPKPVAADVIERMIVAAQAQADDALARADAKEALRVRLKLIALRDVALIRALWTSGMRSSEARSLQISHLNPHKRQASITGKGSKKRVVYFDDCAWESIEAYLTARNLVLPPDLKHPVFARHDRRAAKQVLPLSAGWTLERIFEKLQARAGIDPPFTPHQLRHTFGTTVLHQTHDIAMVQKLMGHESPSTTQRYTRIEDDDLERAHRETQFGTLRVKDEG